MNRADFLERENWHGSYYELAMEFVPRSDDTRLLAAIRALWSAPDLRGPWRKREDFGKESRLPAALEADGSNHLYGVLQLTDGSELGCLSMTVREADGADWLDFCVPTGMLRRAQPVQSPVTRRANPWLMALDERFVALAERIYAVAPFALAAIGEEVSGEWRAATITAAKLARGGIILPPALQAQFAEDTAIPRRPSGLTWYPWRDDDFAHIWIPTTID
jgi:hypothetical protein